MTTLRRVLGLIFFGVMYRDMMRVGMMILMGLFLAAELPSSGLLFVASISIASSFVYANIVNDIYDLELDRKAKAYRPLPSGRYSVGEARAASIAFLLVAVAFGALAALISRSFSLSLLLFATLLACHFYSGPPLRFKARSWLGVVSISLIYLSPLVMGYLIGGVDPESFPLIALIFLAIFLASGTKDFEDIDVDGSMGVITPPVRYGVGTTARTLRYTSILSGLAAAGVGVAYLARGLPAQGAFSIALLPSYAIYAARMARYASSRSREDLMVLVKGCLWTMFVWPFTAAAITLLGLRILLG